MRGFADAMYDVGFAPEAKEFIDSMRQWEGPMKDPHESEWGAESSDDSWTEDKDGVWRILTREQKKLKRESRNAQDDLGMDVGVLQQREETVLRAEPIASRSTSAKPNLQNTLDEERHESPAPKGRVTDYGQTKGVAHSPEKTANSSRTAKDEAMVSDGALPPEGRMNNVAGLKPQKRSRPIEDLIISSGSESESEPEAIPVAGPSRAVLPPRSRQTSESHTKKGKMTKVSRLSLEKACEKVKYSQFKTISDFIDWSRDYEVHGTKRQVLKGCRIVFVNTNTLVNHPKPRNWFDQAHLLNLKIALANGATLVKPEDFVPAPSKARSGPEWERMADKEAWTTHIVTTKLPKSAEPKFSDILPCLGPSGLTVDKIGAYVQVVKFAWISACVYAPSRDSIPISFYTVPGDPRAAPNPATNNYPVIPAPEDASRARADVNEEDEEDEDDIDSEDEEMREISPFGLGDWPYEGVDKHGPTYAREQRRTMQTESGDRAARMIDAAGLELEEDDSIRDASLVVDRPIADVVDESTSSIVEVVPHSAAAAAPCVNDDLALEMALIEQFGDEKVDEVLDTGADFPLKLNPADLTLLIYATDLDTQEIEQERKRKGVVGAPAGMQIDGAMKRRKIGRYACDQEWTGGDKDHGPNELIAKMFEALAESTSSVDRDKEEFRKRSYRRAAGLLRNMSVPVSTYREAVKINGIGHKNAMKLEEIVRTGTSRRLELTSDRDLVLKAFCGIYGVGRHHAEELYQMGARSIRDIMSDEAAFRLTPAQRLGLQYYDDLQERIPRAEITKLYELVVAAAKEVDAQLTVLCMGSYRRGQLDCGDIDLIVTRDHSDGILHTGMIRRLWRSLCSGPYAMARHILTCSGDFDALDAKVNALCSLPEGGKMRRIDILGVPWEQMPAAMIYFTGNDFFNRSMRLKARHLGYCLNQRGLYKHVTRDGHKKLTEGVLVPCKSERDIFDVLGVKWREPHQRMP